MIRAIGAEGADLAQVTRRTQADQNARPLIGNPDMSSVGTDIHRAQPPRAAHGQPPIRAAHECVQQEDREAWGHGPLRIG